MNKKIGNLLSVLCEQKFANGNKIIFRNKKHLILPCSKHLKINAIEKSSTLNKIIARNFNLSGHGCINVATNNKDNYIEYAYDKNLEIISKRLLLEFKNNDLIYLPKQMRFLIESIYKPKHMNLKFLNINTVEQKQFSNSELENLLRHLSVCVVYSKNINEHGEIQLGSTFDDCLSSSIINNMNEHTKLIAVVKLNADEQTVTGDNGSQLLKRKPDLFITNKGVFRINKISNKLELIEFNCKYEDIENVFKSWRFQPVLDRNALRAMPQECI